MILKSSRGNVNLSFNGDFIINGEDITDTIKDLKEQVKNLKEIVNILYHLPPSQGGLGIKTQKTHFESVSQGQG